MKKLYIISLMALAASFLSAQSVLIAKEDTRYKKALVEVLVEKLESQGFTTEIIDHKELSSVDPAAYTAVYVLNSGAQARVRPVVMEWLNLLDNDDNVILHTTQRTQWTPQVKVDSITSASQKSNIEEVSNVIIEKIMALL